MQRPFGRFALVTLLAAVFLGLVAGESKLYAQTPAYGSSGQKSPDTPPPPSPSAVANNGSFETGTFAGWGVSNPCGSTIGNWFVYSGTTSPVSNFTIPAPPAGAFAAVTDQVGPGTHILFQDIALEAGSSHTLTMTLYFNNRHTANITPADFNLDCSNSAGNPNQQFRVDIIRPGALLTTVSPADILQTIFWTANLPTTQLSMAPTPFVADLSAFAGQTVRLRFAEVDNQFFYQAGVDNVQLTSQPQLAGTPGAPYPQSAEVSDQKAGSVLVYNLHTSTIGSTAQNTRINITNINPVSGVAVHLFFVDGSNCNVADSFLCLTANQTASFLASDVDPGTTGYIVAIASSLGTGCPINFNFLIGDEYVKLSSGHAANLGAEAISAISGNPASCDGNSVTADLPFNGVGYNRVPRTVAASNIPSRADGNDTLLVVNRFGGSLATGAATLTGLFGIIYDDFERGLSFGFSPGVCQFRASFSNNFPRLTPRFEQLIPAGRTGWLRLFSQNDQGLFGATINFNPNAGSIAGAFNQGHNLHKLRLTSTVVITVPVFTPSC